MEKFLSTISITRKNQHTTFKWKCLTCDNILTEHGEKSGRRKKYCSMCSRKRAIDAIIKIRNKRFKINANS